ncbi:MAG: hypothetical protein MK082_05575 [Phycisphaerales bacterium]|nr:hypothetical protein [Phycisphaerales bacterium]
MTARVSLRAAVGEPLAEEATRNIVTATAEAIGERTGVTVRVLEASFDLVELEVDGTNLEATALAAELRRLTDKWHHDRHGRSLWGEP